MVEGLANVLILVHDSNLGFAGAIAHLLYVAVRTPAVENRLGSSAEVALLGDADFSAPIASLVVSEESQIPQFDPRIHSEKALCILTLSGCDQDVVDKSGLRVGSVPVVSLKKLFSEKNSLMQLSNLTINELINAGSVHPAEAKNLCDSKIAGCCADLSGTALLIADCVSLFVHTLAQSSGLERDLRAK